MFSMHKRFFSTQASSSFRPRPLQHPCLVSLTITKRKGSGNVTYCFGNVKLAVVPGTTIDHDEEGSDEFDVHQKLERFLALVAEDELRPQDPLMKHLGLDQRNK